jgi:hypothetical protein
MPIIESDGKQYNTVKAEQFVFHVNMNTQRVTNLMEVIDALLGNIGCITNSYYLFYLKGGAKSLKKKATPINQEKIYTRLKECDNNFKLVFDSNWRLNHYDLFTEKFTFFIEINTVPWDKVNMQISLSINEKHLISKSINCAELFNKLSKEIKKHVVSLFYGYSFKLDTYFFPKVYVNGGEYVFNNDDEINRRNPEILALKEYNKNITCFDKKIWRVCCRNIINEQHINNLEKFENALKETKCWYKKDQKNLMFVLPNCSNDIGVEDEKIVNTILPFLNY